MVGIGAAQSAGPRTVLLDLPDAVLTRIAHEALGCRTGAAHAEGGGSSDAPAARAVVTPEDGSSVAAVRLARAHPRLRGAVTRAVCGLRFGEMDKLWPDVRVLAGGAWPGLRELRGTVERGRFCGFLKWALSGTGVVALDLHVVGERYARVELAGLEKMLLGRLFMQVGRALVELEVDGVETRSVLISAVCRCAKLHTLHVRQYAAGGDGESTLGMYMFLILCMVNRGSLTSVEHPFDAGMEVPARAALQEGVEGAWGTLWGSYRAGVKEAAANLPSDAEETKAMFAEVTAQMDDVEAKMTSALVALRAQRDEDPAAQDPSFDALLHRIVPHAQLA